MFNNYYETDFGHKHGPRPQLINITDFALMIKKDQSTVSRWLKEEGSPKMISRNRGGCHYIKSEMLAWYAKIKIKNKNKELT